MALISLGPPRTPIQFGRGKDDAGTDDESRYEYLLLMFGVLASNDELQRDLERLAASHRGNRDTQSVISSS